MTTLVVGRLTLGGGEPLVVGGRLTLGGGEPLVDGGRLTLVGGEPLVVGWQARVCHSRHPRGGGNPMNG